MRAYVQGKQYVLFPDSNRYSLLIRYLQMNETSFLIRHSYLSPHVDTNMRVLRQRLYGYSQSISFVVGVSITWIITQMFVHCLPTIATQGSVKARGRA